ncbi:tol-pal system protein YbgF [Marinobacterium sp. MBR-109]|jgi:tol-pal system protein YbgF|uniref:tol-pal system protein YbgF n=1 Tax=Marinobacterium sp. MBR-109 TaxID=3156462 RepID=UPI00339864BD
MKSAATAKATVLLVLASSWSYAAPVPVIEITETPVASRTGGTQSLQVQSTGGVSVQNELLFSLQQLQDEVRMLRGALEEQQHKLERLEQQQRERYRDMDRRISLLMSAMPDDALLTAQTALEQSQPTVKVPDAAENAATDTSAERPAASDTAAYDKAYSHVRQREFDQAEKAFELFLNDYQNSALVPNAWYWLGEVKLAQGKVEAAGSAFNQVITGYPVHAKAADALYKLGVLAERGGDGATAKSLMQRVQNEYPQSSAAGLARSFLSNQQ